MSDRLSDRVEYHLTSPQVTPHTQARYGGDSVTHLTDPPHFILYVLFSFLFPVTSMTSPCRNSTRLTQLATELPTRYTTVLPHLARVRVLTGSHLDQLLTDPHTTKETTARVRRRIMTRLVINGPSKGDHLDSEASESTVGS